MLVEIKSSFVDLSSGDLRRWFEDEYFDLFVWQNDQNKITAFQLCYDRLGKERAISWYSSKGFYHYYVDGGEQSSHKNMTPIFLSKSVSWDDNVIPLFTQASQHIDVQIKAFILDKLHDYWEQLQGL